METHQRNKTGLTVTLEGGGEGGGPGWDQGQEQDGEEQEVVGVHDGPWPTDHWTPATWPRVRWNQAIPQPHYQNMNLKK